MKRKIIAAFTAAIIAVCAAAPQAFADKWVNTENGYTYQYDDGTVAKKGWLKIDGKTYYIQKNGTRKTGWLKTSSGNKYYFDKNGVMYKSKWLTFKSGDKYYLTANGKAALGVVKIDKTEYKFSDEGKYLGVNHHFILNEETSCLHSTKCRAAEKIDKENYSELDIGENEFSDYSKNGYWACGVNGCNSKNIRKALPKPKD